VGVLGQLSVDNDADTCSADLAFVYSVRNLDVKALVESGCARAGGCGPRSDAGQADTDAGTNQPADGGRLIAQDGGKTGPLDGGLRRAMRDSGPPPVIRNRVEPPAACGCNAIGGCPSVGRGTVPWGLAMFGLAAARRRARKRRSSTTARPPASLANQASLKYLARVLGTSASNIISL
jgi:hypothetical protein